MLADELKQLDKKQTKALAEAIREELVEKVKETGGHLASNLGAVELTVALYKVFDFPVDKLIFDVGHQRERSWLPSAERGHERLSRPGGERARRLYCRPQRHVRGGGDRPVQRARSARREL